VDLRLVQHVLEELADDPLLDTSNIRVNASSGRIILTGSVPSESQRLIAERDAWWVDTVRAVDNRLVLDMQRNGTRSEHVPGPHESAGDLMTTIDD
jgi:osmotically-inducible protein OsmY